MVFQGHMRPVGNSAALDERITAIRPPKTYLKKTPEIPEKFS